MSGTITGNYPGQTAVKRLWKNIVGAFVKKENGKGLSTEDYTTTEKNKLENMQEISGIQRNGTDLTPDVSTKKVNVEVPILGVIMSYPAAATILCVTALSRMLWI